MLFGTDDALTQQGSDSMVQKRMIDVDELRKELGFSEMCDNCKQDTWACGRDTFYSLKDFCERLDDAIDAILERHKDT